MQCGEAFHRTGNLLMLLSGITADSAFRITTVAGDFALNNIRRVNQGLQLLEIITNTVKECPASAASSWCMVSVLLGAGS